MVVDTKGLDYISTHTLTRSVTISDEVKIVNNFISTHTLTWSVTSDFGFPVTVTSSPTYRSGGFLLQKQAVGSRSIALMC